MFKLPISLDFLTEAPIFYQILCLFSESKLLFSLLELSDWFLDQMLVARGAGDEEEIKRNYKRRNAELKQRRTELEARLSDTRQVISNEAANERSAKRKSKRTLSSPSSPSKSSPTINENRLSTGRTAETNEDTGNSLL